jgi:ABC-type uncharacterized transport system substrate-binding protein
MKRFFVFLIISILLILGCKAPQKKEKSILDDNLLPKQKKTIVVVHSYSADHVCGRPQGDGIELAFARSLYDITWESIYMETKTKNSTPELIAKESEKALSKIDELKPDLVFVLDDNAIINVGFKLLGTDIPVVFSGMNNIPENINKKYKFMNENREPIANITGIYEYLYAEKSFSLLEKIIPEFNTIVAIIDKTPTGDAITKQLKLELSEAKSPLKVRIERVGSMKEYGELIAKINKDPKVSAVYNIALGLKDNSKSMVGVPTTFKYYLNNSIKPSIALNYSFCKLGLFGGAAVDFQAMGNQAGLLGRKILNDEPIKDIKVTNAEKYMIIFNEARAKELKITIPNDVLLVADELYSDIPLK